jgi:hypothetical protein
MARYCINTDCDRSTAWLTSMRTVHYKPVVRHKALKLNIYLRKMHWQLERCPMQTMPEQAKIAQDPSYRQERCMQETHQRRGVIRVSLAAPGKDVINLFSDLNFLL